MASPSGASTIHLTLRRCLLAAVALVVSVAGGAAPASAAVTIGSELTAPPEGTNSCLGGSGVTCVIMQTGLPGRQVASPINGVVTRFRSRGGAGQARLRVVRPGPNGFIFVSSTPYAASAGGTGVSTVPVQMQVRAGDFIAVDGAPGAQAPYRSLAGATAQYFEPSPPDGANASPSFSPNGLEYLFNADVEADADGDGFGDETQDGCTSDPGTQGPCPSPEIGRTANVEPVRGEVLVRERGTNRFVPLTADTQIGLGSVVDVRHGEVRVIAVDSNSGQARAAGSGITKQSGLFSGGVFSLSQAVRGQQGQVQQAITQLALSGSTKPCPRTGPGSRAEQRFLVSRKASPRFRTRGRYGTATAIAKTNTWRTADRCDGTLLTVRQGVVEVRDLTRKRTVRVRAGHQYFARRGNR